MPSHSAPVDFADPSSRSTDADASVAVAYPPAEDELDELSAVSQRVLSDWLERRNQPVQERRQVNRLVVRAASPQPAPRFERLKRAADVALASTLGLLALPLIGLIALAIKLDSPGPVLFVQKRPGRGGRMFRIYKFRTMYPRQDQRRKAMRLASNDEFQQHGKLRQDPRVTRVGQLLRATSLDELPQLWNILMGDMSLIGPRPYLRSQLQQINGRQHELFRVRPGLTGLWQVNGRNTVPMKRRLAMDLWYVRNRSFRLDGMILLRTVPAVLRRDGAY